MLVALVALGFFQLAQPVWSPSECRFVQTVLDVDQLTDLAASALNHTGYYLDLAAGWGRASAAGADYCHSGTMSAAARTEALERFAFARQTHSTESAHDRAWRANYDRLTRLFQAAGSTPVPTDFDMLAYCLRLYAPDDCR